MSSPRAGRTPGPDPYLDLADDAIHAEAVRRRSEARSRQERAADLATWAGTLRDLAERGCGVVVGCAAGHAHRGVLERIGADHIVVRGRDGRQVFVVASAVRSVRPEPGASRGPARGDRGLGNGRTIIEVLEHWLEEREPVALVLEGEAGRVRGEVVGLGDDVVSLCLDNARRSIVYVPTAKITEIGRG